MTIPILYSGSMTAMVPYSRTAQSRSWSGSYLWSQSWDRSCCSSQSWITSQCWSHDLNLRCWSFWK